MKKLSSVVAGVAAGVAMAVATVAFAQPYGGMGQGYGPGMGMGPGYGKGMGMGPGHGPMANVDPVAAADARIANLKTQLKITSAQETAWQGFANAAKQQAASMQAARAQMSSSAGTAPERMAQRTQLMEQRLAGMATMTNAVKELYAALTPEQKVLADQYLAMGGQRGMGHGRWGG